MRRTRQYRKRRRSKTKKIGGMWPFSSHKNQGTKSKFWSYLPSLPWRRRTQTNINEATHEIPPWIDDVHATTEESYTLNSHEKKNTSGLVPDFSLVEKVDKKDLKDVKEYKERWFKKNSICCDGYPGQRLIYQKMDDRDKFTIDYIFHQILNLDTEGIHTFVKQLCSLRKLDHDNPNYYSHLLPEHRLLQILKLHTKIPGFELSKEKQAAIKETYENLHQDEFIRLKSQYGLL